MSFGASGVRGAKQSSFADAVLHFPAVHYTTLDTPASNFVRKRTRRVWSSAFQVGTSPSIQSHPKPSHKETLCLETSTHPQLLCPMRTDTHTHAGFPSSRYHFFQEASPDTAPHPRWDGCILSAAVSAASSLHPSHCMVSVSVLDPSSFLQAVS